MKDLRLEVLLQPIGLTEQYINDEQEKGDFLIGAFEGEQMVGCCVLTPKEHGSIQLRQMAVGKSVQGKGIGAAIVAFAEKLAAEKGFSLLLMHARNEVMEFYAKSGYQVEGTEFVEAGIGHHRMQKRLKE